MKKTAAVQVCTSYVSVSVFCTDCIVHSTAQVDILCDASYIKKYQKKYGSIFFPIEKSNAYIANQMLILYFDIHFDLGCFDRTEFVHLSATNETLAWL